MRIASVTLICLLFVFGSSAQFHITSSGSSWQKIYRASETRINDLVHTRLDARFDYARSYLYGKVWLTLKPHFYATDSLRLDAKGMDIHKVSLVKNNMIIPLKYTYDSLNLFCTLDKTYKGGEAYTIFIDYTSKPDEYKVKGSAAITDAKGLYFINPLGKEQNKPTQIWTQGETEGTSVWVPTIDRPNQKTTEEISMTVPAKYVTLSNGKLVSQRKNTDGTRTDTWRMDLPHAPYLFFMGVGVFSIVRDTYKGKEVSYYVEKEYESVARKIFGETPSMIKFFSEKLGVEYPWTKYAQMVGRDYVSGAMENTTATLHREALQQNARELTDGNKFEEYIPHELFHQWFGDLVTAESWSNLTVNESMANYSEVIWDKYRHGNDAAEARNYHDMLEYFLGGGQNKDLVRYFYNDKEDMFDVVSYNKGGRILHMLKDYVGDSAFFKSLNLYLSTNKFRSAEAAQLRLAFEETTGRDLQWFWNQWYYGNGHPKLEVNYTYDSATRIASVYLKQTQTGDKVFGLPFAIDVYNAGERKRYNVWMNSKEDTFHFNVSSKPDLINVDADKILLAEKKDNKTLEAFLFQYNHATNYVDRREAIDFAMKHKDEPEAKTLLEKAIDDPYYELRERVLKNLNAKDLSEPIITKILVLAKSDPKRTTRAEAIDVLAELHNKEYEKFFVASTNDSSYSVSGAALEALIPLDEAKAISLLPVLRKDSRGRLTTAIKTVEVLTKGDADFEVMTRGFDSLSLFDKFGNYKNYLTFLGNVNTTANFKKGIDKIVAFRNAVGGFSAQLKTAINEQLIEIKIKKIARKASTSDNSAIEEQTAYIDKVAR